MSYFLEENMTNTAGMPEITIRDNISDICIIKIQEKTYILLRI